MDHCIAKIAAIVARGEPDPRSVLQLGYNLGRLSELTGLGRGPFWDRWKGPVEAWDRAELGRLARELPVVCGQSPSPSSCPPTAEPG